MDIVVGVYPKPRRYPDLSHRPWRVEYDLAYDGGGSRFTKYYRTRRGARISIWWNMHVSSWGGSAKLIWQDLRT